MVKTRKLRKSRKNRTMKGGALTDVDVKDFISKLKKVDLHVHMGAICTRKWLLDHFSIMRDKCKVKDVNETIKNNSILLQTFIQKTCIEYLNPLPGPDGVTPPLFKKSYTDLRTFQIDCDKYSDMLKILCGVNKGGFIYSPPNVFKPSDCISSDSTNEYGSMKFMKHVLDHFMSEQKLHGCVAMEISQTPFTEQTGDPTYFQVCNEWMKAHNDYTKEEYFPVAFISTCIRHLSDSVPILQTMNKNIVKTISADESNEIVKAIGIASAEIPVPIKNREGNVISVPQYLCPDPTLSNYPFAMRVWMENKCLELGIKRSQEGPIKLIPHVGEEYYGDDGENVLKSVGAYLQFNEESTIDAFAKLGVPLQCKLERIAHGCQCARSVELCKKLAYQKMTCEICISSNNAIQSTRATNYKENTTPENLELDLENLKPDDENTFFVAPPLIILLKKNVPVVLCSDDPAVFSMGEKGCILMEEYEEAYNLMKKYYYSEKDALTELVEIANRSIEKSLALIPRDKDKFKTDNNGLLEEILLKL